MKNGRKKMYSSFHKEFFPTPGSLAYELASEHRGKVRSVLDPSAGKGDLLAPFEDYKVSLYGIEQSLELCSILRGKKITVLGYDFFNYGGEHFFDLVIMNPPFSNCVDHFMHAWNFCNTRCIVALLPKRVTLWGSTKDETIEKVIHDHGKVQDLGKAFTDAERKTGVEVVKVTVKKPQSTMRVFSFNPDMDEYEPLDVPDVLEGGIVKRDIISTIASQYEGSVAAIRELLIAVNKIRNSVGMLVSKNQLDDMIRDCLQSDTVGESHNKLVDAVKMGCWNSIFRDSELSRYMTSSCLKEFQRFAEDNKGLAFNEENIASIMESLVMSNSEIFKQNIVEVFDLLTKFHKENRSHFEGWKTNDRWRVKKKFILPYIVQYNTWGMSRSFHRTTGLRDIDTAMCTITGNKIGEVDGIGKAIERGCREGWPVDSTFFRIKCYQKGTGHFEFLDKGLWDQFNRIACDGKKWLPE